MSEITLPASNDSVATGVTHVARCASDFGFQQKRIDEIMLAVEEALVNICNYAYPDAPGEVRITCSEGPEGEFLVTFFDSGRPFDPLQAQSPDLSSDLEGRPIGGLGIMLIKAMSDRVAYSRREGMNILEIGIRPEG